jgi:DNA-binding transcriptional ArsR family regulator
MPVTTRWEVEHAVLRSNLAGPARLVVLALAVKSDNETAMIPPEFSPSLSTLAAMTGLARSVVAEHLTRLEDLHWVKRARPARKSKYERTSYALSVGINDPGRPSSPGAGRLADSPGDEAVREPDGSSPGETDSAVRLPDCSESPSSPGDGPPVVREPDGSPGPSSPGAGHAPTKELPTDKPKQERPPKKARPKVADIPRPDVDEICTYLADKIEANGSKRPEITKEWRRDARLLLDEKRPIQPTVV